MSDTPPPRFKKKPVKEGHEAFLKALEAAGARVSLTLVSDPDTTMSGTIKHSDKYTISLRVDRDDGTYQVYVIFKHAIEMFWTNPNDKT
jgi:sRNA-binding regulator protein Hfq